MRHARTPFEVRFWRKVDRRGPDECWLWIGRKDGGYGSLSLGGRGSPRVVAHRASFELKHGPIPPGLFVCHRCDTPRCVNPAHLFLGTNADNMHDALIKGRLSHVNRGRFDGEKNPAATLTEDAVRAIRRELSMGHSQSTIAAKFGTTQSAVSRIKLRRTWACVS